MYFVLINGCDYLIPEAVVINNQDIFMNYVIEVNGLKYLDISKLFSSGMIDVISKIYNESCSAVSMRALDICDDKFLSEYNSLDDKLREFGKEMRDYFDKDQGKSLEILNMGFETILKLYQEINMGEDVIYNRAK